MLSHPGTGPGIPYLHRVRFTGLRPGTKYQYTIRQADHSYAGHFRTAPLKHVPVRFIVFADAETEPESTGSASRWRDPAGLDSHRRYVTDQATGYAANIEIIRSREPDFVAIAGDLVEPSGAQRDWDEFWRHIGELAGTTPILPAVGNHENFGGPGGLGRFTLPAATRAMAKYRTYFEVPYKGAPRREQEDRYYRIDYGPVTLITVDTSNGLPGGGRRDTNFRLIGEGEFDAQGREGETPDFNPGSRQHQWLDHQLADAQISSKFTFVQFHHMPYSVGPHGFAPGTMVTWKSMFFAMAKGAGCRC